MTVAESIQQYVRQLPDALQLEVLNFVEYLLFKQTQEALEAQDQAEWSNFSVASAMRGMENEETPLYTLDDLREQFS